MTEFELAAARRDIDTAMKIESGNDAIWQGGLWASKYGKALIARLDAAERERDELRAAQGWRAIDSAPRDGTKVDLWSRSHYGDGRITDAWYVGNEWFVFNDIGTPEAISHHHHVTHWQPLPSPPTR